MAINLVNAWSLHTLYPLDTPTVKFISKSVKRRKSILQRQGIYLFFFYFSLYLKSSKLVQGLLTLVIGTSCLSMTGLRGQKGRKLFQLCLLNLENQFMVNTKHSMGKIWACLGHSGRKSALDKWLNETWWTDGHRINDNRTNKHHCRALEL